MGIPRPVELEDLPAWRAHVLVVGDEAAAQVNALRRDGHDVSVLEDGVELLERLSEPDAHQRYHLVLADVELDGFTGIEVLGLTDGMTQRPPVVLLSALADLEMRAAARQFGATALIATPADVDEIRLIVGALLRPHYRSPAPAAAA